MLHRPAALLASVCLIVSTAIAGAQEQATPASEANEADKLTLELNRVSQTDGGCRIGFVTSNELGADLSKAAFEIVLFDQEGLIERLLVLDFGAMPDGKTKVREFNLTGTQCSGISRVLLNDVSACEGDGLEKGACAAAISVSSKSDVAFDL